MLVPGCSTRLLLVGMRLLKGTVKLCNCLDLPTPMATPKSLCSFTLKRSGNSHLF